MALTRFCPKCGKVVPFGIHLCIPKAPDEKSTPLPPIAALPHKGTDPLPHSLPHRGSARQKKWRASRLDQHRAYHREYMRRYRGEAKAKVAPQKQATPVVY